MLRLKYLSILVLPTTVVFSFTLHGMWSFLPHFVFFVLVPMVELLAKPWNGNPSDEALDALEKDPFFNAVLYLMVPIQWVFVGWFLWLMTQEMTLIERLGRISSMGVMCGIIGINVGHELGHRLNRFEQFLGELLLLSSLENHFLPYHNSGHHANVGTPGDPATARLNEPVYQFILRSHFGSYFQAWSFECQRMKIMNRKSFSLYNRMMQYSIVSLLFLSLIALFCGVFVLLYFVLAAMIGIVLLELVNYIEHYGLMRKQRENGTFEVFKRRHAWNSNHPISRSLLFELSRHSDHHMKPDKPYQLLECDSESPVMPTGYAGMMILSLVPPLFFKAMNARVSEALQEK